MEVKQLLIETFLEIDRGLERSLDTLTHEELIWRPIEEANSIAFTFWHLARAEDVWVNKIAQKSPQVFGRDGWSHRWNIAAEDTGAGYTKENLAAFISPSIEELWEFYRSVRIGTLDYIDKLNLVDLDQLIEYDDPRIQGYTVGRMFGHIICELSQHLGHIRYLRGLQRGLNQ